MGPSTEGSNVRRDLWPRFGSERNPQRTFKARNTGSNGKHKWILGSREVEHQYFERSLSSRLTTPPTERRPIPTRFMKEVPTVTDVGRTEIRNETVPSWLYVTFFKGSLTREGFTCLRDRYGVSTKFPYPFLTVITKLWQREGEKLLRKQYFSILVHDNNNEWTKNQEHCQRF